MTEQLGILGYNPLTDQEKRTALSRIRKIAGNPSGTDNYKEKYNKAIQREWESNWKLRIPFSNFQHDIHDWSEVQSAKKPKRSTNSQSKDKRIVFVDLYKHIVHKCGSAPSDIHMNAVGDYFGLSRSIAGVTRSQLEKSGYQFTQKTNGFGVEVPDPNGPLKQAIQRQIEMLQNRLNELNTKEYSKK